MKKLFLLPALLLLVGCVSLPTLTPENQTLAQDVSTYLCFANKNGLLQENVELTPEKLQSLFTEMQNSNIQAPQVVPEELQPRLEALQNDPIQLGLFAKEVLDLQQACETTPAQ